MAARIFRTDEADTGRTVLQVQGSLTLEYAQLLEELCRDAKAQSERSVIIDLAGVTFLDEASAAVLRRLKQQPGVALTGCQLYTRQMIEESGAPA